MRSGVRVLGPVTVVIAAVLALAWTSRMAAVVHLLADTAINKTILVMGGTQHPLWNPEVLRPNFGDRPLKKALQARTSLRPKSTDGSAGAVSKDEKTASKPENKVGPRRPDKVRHHDDAA